MPITRRTILGATGAIALGTPTHEAKAQMKSLKLLLNTSLSGPVSFFLLANARDYLREEGLSVAFSGGGGAAVVVPQVRHGSYDAGYGDISALIERIARGKPNEGPVAVYTTFNTVPFTIAVPANSPLRTPKDFEGRTIVGHAMDAALITFDMLASAAGVDAGKVRIDRASSSMGSQVADMLAGRGADGVFGFVNTIIASVAPMGIAAKDLRFINYADYLPDMYGNTLFVTRELYRSSPKAITGMVRAFNRALRDTVTDPNLAIDALQAASPSIRRDVDYVRLVGTLKSEMAHPEGAKLGIGEMDDARLKRLIALIVKVKGLPRTPDLREVFDRSFLPPLEERVRSLAR